MGLWWTLAAAWAGSFDGDLAVDTLFATSQSDAIEAGTKNQAAADLGLTVRGELQALKDRLVVGVDYRGRVPYLGEFRNRELHLVYRADVAWRFNRVELGLGRFIAPSATWLSVDGLRGTLDLDKFRATVFAGRRAISISRQNLPFDALLPVVGTHLGYLVPAGGVELAANLAGDRFLLGTLEDPVEEDVLGGSVLLRSHLNLGSAWRFGAQGSVANQATFAVGPNVGDLTLTVQALSLYQALGWGSFKPAPAFRVDATVLHQQVTLTADAESLPIVDPSFTDLRVRSVIGKPTLAFVRPDVRLRLRQARTELRWGGAFEVHPPFLRGPYVLGRAWLEHVFQEPGALDRVLWQLGAGWERGILQAEAGIGVIDRAAGPVSARASDPLQSGVPLQSEDLSPFVLESQNVAFARAFVVGRHGWFVGADAEVNLLDAEVRAFVQLGLRGRASW